MAISLNATQLTVGMAQIAPIWLNREKTLDKMIDYAHAAKRKACQLVVFGEALLPGYPFWIELTDGARFNSPFQKELHAHYVNNAVDIEAGHIKSLCQTAADQEIAVVLGCIEKPSDRVVTASTPLLFTSTQAATSDQFIAS